VSIVPGPNPTVDNIRLIVTAEPSVEMLWAVVRQGSQTIRGAIPLAGGRGEQVVNGYPVTSRVTVYADPGFDPSTESCMYPAAAP
jgi:hypothetical protein